MAFPEEDLGLRVEVQTGTSWLDITKRCQLSEPITHKRGIRNGGSIADAASASLKINNKDGYFSPRNPTSPLWGFIGRNTPVRLWLPGGDRFLDLDGNPANYASTPDNAALDITGDLDLRVEADISWYHPTANQVLIQKWDSPGQRSYALRVFDQLLNFTWSDDGVTNRFAARTLPPLPSHAAVRATLDVNDGSGQYVVRLYWAPSITGPWTQVGADLVGPATSVFSGTAPLRVGGYDPTTTPPRTPFEGKGYKAEVRNGINGTLVASPDFTAQPLGAAGFTDSAGRTWSYSGNAAVADRQEVFVGEISSWPQDWVPSGQAVWTKVEAAGILRRYGQGQKALDSTLRRRIPSANPIAYWPMEEEQQASRAYSPIAGVQAAALTGVEWAAVDTLPSSRALPRLTAAATLSAIVPIATAGQWQVECVYNADDKAPPASGDWAEFLNVSSTGTVRRWAIGMRKDRIRVSGTNASGTEIVILNIILSEDKFHGWYRFRFYTRDLGGGQMQWVLETANVNGAILQVAQTITGTPGYVQAVTANWGPLTEGWSIGHLSVMPVAANTIYDGSDSAYSGETAWERMRRLANEEGLPIARIPGELTPERVGPQRPLPLVDLLQAAAAADGGMLLEDRRRLGLVYRDRSSLYSQEPALTLVYGAPGLAPPLTPVDDDQATRNDRTITRDGGSSARAVLEEGRLSVQPPPLGAGLYDDSQTLSLGDDTQTEPIAYWQLHLGTHDGARYPSVRVLLHRAPHLIPAVLAMREGDLIRLANLPPWVAFGDVDLIATGWSETLKPRTWERTFVCAAGGPWNTAKADHPTFGKAGPSDTRLVADVTATATLLDVQTTAGLDWTTDPAEMPIPIAVSGEEMHATAITQYGDTFGRTVAGGWGTSDTGVVWSTSGGSASDYFVGSGVGKHALASPNVSRRTMATAPSADLDLTVDMAPSSVATGGFYSGGLIARSEDGNNLYQARLSYETTGQLTLTLRKRVAGTETQLETFSPGAYTAGQVMRLRFQLDGPSLRAKAWPVSSGEPVDWQAVATDTALSAAGQFGMRSITGAGNTNILPTVDYDTFTVAGLQRITVVRSVNGVVKAQSAGALVRLGHPAIASL